MSIESELISLTDPDEMIHANKVVQWARTHRSSELHKEFDWNDTSAAHKHRVDQARRLIQIHVVYPIYNKRSTVSLVIDRSQGGGYRQLQPVLNNKTMRDMLVKQILDELMRVIDRYPQLTEISVLQAQIAALRQSFVISEAAD